MLYFVGLGLGDPTDITVKGLDLVKKCDKVYLESYTSILTGCSKEVLEEFYGRPLVEADRDFVEQEADQMIQEAREGDVALLVVGDPFGATTHSDLMLRAAEKGVPTKAVHNASIMNAIGCCGLQLYRFGETVSVPFWTEDWQPDSFFDKIVNNIRNGFHTLCLLDIKVKERSVENMMRGKDVFEPPRFMTCAQAAEQLVKIIRKRLDGASSSGQTDQDQDEGKERAPVALTEQAICLAVARIGTETQKMVYCSLAEMVDLDLGPPLHSLVIPAAMHPLELDCVRRFSSPVLENP